MKKEHTISPAYAERLEKWAHEPPIVEGRANWKRSFDRKTLGRNKSNPFPFASVPLHNRHHAQNWFNQRIAKLKAEGVEITQGKIASLMGNAAFYAKYIITGKMNWWFRRAQKKRKNLKILRERKAMAEFKAQPLESRRKNLI